MRLSEKKGGYRITVFTAPTPFRAGPVDISVFVQDYATGAWEPEVSVTVRAARRDQPAALVSYPATTEASTNKLYRAAHFDLPEPGWWVMEVVVEGSQQTIRVSFEVEAEAPAPRWLSWWPWVAWPCVAIILYVIHQFLLGRKSR